jgi:hypothetical protein
VIASRSRAVAHKLRDVFANDDCAVNTEPLDLPTAWRLGSGS